MKIILIIVAVFIIFYIIGMLAPDDDSANDRSNSHPQQNNMTQRPPPPNYRYWNGVEYDNKEVRCDWCGHLRTEKETGKKYCSKYSGYVDLNYVCDSYVCGIEEVAKELANIFKEE